MVKMLLNEEKQGVELYFEGKPEAEILTDLKSNGYRWNGKKVCWYAKQNENTLELANKYSNTEVKTTIHKRDKNIKIIDLFELTNIKNIEADKIEVSSKYDHKEISKTCKSFLSKRFPFVKFSMNTKGYSSINAYIVSSPFAEDSKEFKAIQSYCKAYLNQYNYNNSDLYSDYHDVNFYGGYFDTCDYIQTELKDIEKVIDLYSTKVAEQKEKEYKEMLIRIEERERQREIDRVQHEEREAQEQKQVQAIEENTMVKDLEENDQYFVIDSKFAHINKNCTLNQYKEYCQEVDGYSLETVRIEKELHFVTAEDLENFSNLLMNEFSFLENTGGSYTNDPRITSINDFYKMTEEEKTTVQWYLKGVAVYFNNELQFIIDTQGHSYARYVGLVDGATVEKNQVDEVEETEEIKQLKEQSLLLSDYSFEVIQENSLIGKWNSIGWNCYKRAIKEKFKANNFKLTIDVIRQIEHEELKNAMYRLLEENDTLHEQFNNSNFVEGEKITIYTSGAFGVCTTKVTYKSHELTEYAQYKDAVKMIYRPSNKRKDYYSYYYDKTIIVKGWIDIPEEKFFEIKKENGFTTKTSKYGMCDNNALGEVIKYLQDNNIKMVINNYKPIF